MKKRDWCAMKEMDLKFNKTVKFSLSVANLRNQAMLYRSLDIYLQHTLIVCKETWIDSKICVEVGKSALFSTTTHFKLVTYSLKMDSNVQKFNECLIIWACPCEKIQDGQSFRILVFCIKQKKNVIEFTSWCFYCQNLKRTSLMTSSNVVSITTNLITLFDLIVKLNVLK